MLLILLHTCLRSVRLADDVSFIPLGTHDVTLLTYILHWHALCRVYTEEYMVTPKLTTDL